MSSTALVEKKTTEMGTKIASEAVTNIRTVASLSKFSRISLDLHFDLLLKKSFLFFNT